MPEKTDHDILTEIHTVLLGTNGTPGLCKQVEHNTKSINKLWICIAVIGSSIGGGAYGIVKLLIG
jgi:L-serine deaminase